MGKPLTLQLNDGQVQRLEEAARRMGRDPMTAAAVLLDEALRHSIFPSIEFRDSAVGRQAYLHGTRLAVWQVIRLDRLFGDESEVATHLEVPIELIQAALDYARAFPTEIAAAIEDADATAGSLPTILPAIEVVTIRAADS